MDNKTLNLFNLNRRICVITGGAGLLGLKHAEALLDCNGVIVLLDINLPKLSKEAAKLRLLYGFDRVFCSLLDVTDKEAIKKVIGTVIRELGPIKVLINNAANNPPVSNNRADTSFTRFEYFTLENWHKDIDVGLTGAFLMSQCIGQHMAECGSGVIVNVASDLGVIAPDQRIYRRPGLRLEEQPTKPATYSVVKHGLIGLTKFLATYWAYRGVRVNSISPGGVYTEQPPEFVEKLAGLIPLGRMANSDEYKAAIAFLCSDASSYMTGANLIIDGGRTCW